MAKKSNVLPEDPQLEKMREIARSHGGKYTLLDTDGNMVVPPVYDLISAPVDGICLIKKDGKYGYIYTDGSILVEPLYEKAWSFSNGLAAVETDGKWGFIDKSGKVVITPQYDDCPYFSEGLAAVNKNNKWGYIDLTGKVIIEPAYERAANFQNGLGMVMLNGKYGFVNARGEMVIAPQFEDVKTKLWGGVWRGNVAIATSGGATGLIDVTGQWVLLPKYAEIKLFSDMASARQEVNGEVFIDFETTPGGKGLVSQNGRIVVQPVFKELSKFSEGLAAAVETSGKCGYINLKGEWAIAPQYNSVSDFRGNLARVRIKDRRYVINQEGKEVGDEFKLLKNVIAITVDIIPDRYCIKKNGKWGLFDGNLKEILPPEFDDIERWGQTKLIKVTKDGKYGLFDKNGKEILPVKYKQLDIVREDAPLAVVGEEWGTNEGAINADGEWVIPPVYSSCYVYGKAGVVTVKKDGLEGLMDMEGREILPCSLDRIGSWDSNMTRAKKDGKYGILSNKGEWVIKPEFEDIDNPSEGLAAARKDNKWGFVNQNGEWVLEPVWNRIQTDGFINGVAIVKDDNDKSVIIDRTGKVLTKPASTVNLYGLHDGMMRIQVGRKFGYLTDDCKVAIKPTFDEAEDFSQGWAQVSFKVDKQPVWTFIDREGRYGPVYNDRISLFGTLTKVTQDEKIALLRPDGTMATPYIFSRVDDAAEGFIPAKIAGF